MFLPAEQIEPVWRDLLEDGLVLVWVDPERLLVKDPLTASVVKDRMSEGKKEKRKKGGWMRLGLMDK